MATLTDFENIGELGVFISEKQITALESIMKEKGFFDDKHLFHTFNCLKPDELLWPF